MLNLVFMLHNNMLLAKISAHYIKKKLYSLLTYCCHSSYFFARGSSMSFKKCRLLCGQECLF